MLGTVLGGSETAVNKMGGKKILMPLWNFVGAKRQVKAVKSHSKVSSEEEQMSDRLGQDAILDKTGKTSLRRTPCKRSK